MRRSHLLVAALVVAALACLVSGVVTVLGLPAGSRGAEEEGHLLSALWQLSMVGFLAVGTLLAGKRPRNPVGWVVLSLPVLVWSGFALSAAAEARALGGAAPSEGALLADWASTSLAPPAVLVGAMFVLLTFPEGHPSRLGRWLLRVVVPLSAVWALARATSPMPLDAVKVPNPYAIEGLGVLAPLATGFGDALGFALLAAGVDVFLRYRRSRGTERQQFRWVVRSLLAAPLGIAVSSVGEAILPPAVSPITDLVGVWLTAFGVAAGIGVAVLRYRLYDIDRIVSRTLGYALVTTILLAVYAGAVVILGAAARAMTGSVSDLVVALSTLSVAAAFQPVRNRVQRMVDRRFNRARYDAQRTSEAFSQRLRDQVDLGELRGDLASTVRRSLAPSTVGVWLPEEASS